MHWRASTRVGAPGAGMAINGRETHVSAEQPATPERQLAAARRARFDATVLGDVPTLERLIADDLTYIHSTARVDTKSSFIHALGERGLPYKAFDVEEQQVRVFGDAGIITAIIRLTLRGDEGDRIHRSRCTDVWAHRDGRWQEVSWQATRIAE